MEFRDTQEFRFKIIDTLRSWGKKLGLEGEELNIFVRYKFAEHNREEKLEEQRQWQEECKEKRRKHEDKVRQWQVEDEEKQRKHEERMRKLRAERQRRSRENIEDGDSDKSYTIRETQGNNKLSLTEVAEQKEEIIVTETELEDHKGTLSELEAIWCSAQSKLAELKKEGKEHKIKLDEYEVDTSKLKIKMVEIDSQLVGKDKLVEEAQVQLNHKNVETTKILEKFSLREENYELTGNTTLREEDIVEIGKMEVEKEEKYETNLKRMAKDYDNWDKELLSYKEKVKEYNVDLNETEVDYNKLKIKIESMEKELTRLLEILKVKYGILAERDINISKANQSIE